MSYALLQASYILFLVFEKTKIEYILYCLPVTSLFIKNFDK